MVEAVSGINSPIHHPERWARACRRPHLTGYPFLGGREVSIAPHLVDCFAIALGNRPRVRLPPFGIGKLVSGSKADDGFAIILLVPVLTIFLCCFLEDVPSVHPSGPGSSHPHSLFCPQVIGG